MKPNLGCVSSARKSLFPKGAIKVSLASFALLAEIRAPCALPRKDACADCHFLEPESPKGGRQLPFVMCHFE